MKAGGEKMKFEIRELTPTEALEVGALYELKITENNGFSWHVYECKNMLQVIALITTTLDDVTITTKDGILTISKKEV